MEIDVDFKNTRARITVDLKITSKRNRKKRKRNSNGGNYEVRYFSGYWQFWPDRGQEFG
ncbi:hypothetical protein ME782_18360 [Lactobacillus delbrueckii]|nr:hypothetical protein ME782_18360 [Lactobacillus delbrueckii]